MKKLLLTLSFVLFFTGCGSNATKPDDLKSNDLTEISYGSKIAYYVTLSDTMDVSSLNVGFGIKVTSIDSIKLSPEGTVIKVTNLEYNDDGGIYRFMPDRNSGTAMIVYGYSERVVALERSGSSYASGISNLAFKKPSGTFNVSVSSVTYSGNYYNFKESDDGEYINLSLSSASGTTNRIYTINYKYYGVNEISLKPLESDYTYSNSIINLNGSDAARLYAGKSYIVQGANGVIKTGLVSYTNSSVSAVLSTNGRSIDSVSKLWIY